MSVHIKIVALFSLEMSNNYDIDGEKIQNLTINTGIHKPEQSEATIVQLKKKEKTKAHIF